MALVTFVVTARDSQSDPPGLRMTALTPTWVFLKRLSDLANVAQPAITEIGQGQYLTAFDAEALGDSAGQIDFGGTLAAPADRYVDVLLTRESSRILTNVDGPVTVGALDLPDGVEAGLTLRQALRGIVAEAMGSITASGSTIRIKSMDGAKNRATATVDSETGARSVSARDLT